MAVHRLKTWTEYFDRVWAGAKTCELRRDDRDFQVGDDVFLDDVDPESKAYLGRTIQVRICDVVRDAPHFGLAEGHCIFSFRLIQRHEPDLNRKPVTRS